MLSSAVHAAALAGHASTVKLLLSHKAQMDAVDLLKHTPLFRACEMGHMEVVQALIEHGAAVDVMDQDGRSPLHWYKSTIFLIVAIHFIISRYIVVLNDDILLD